MTDLAHLQSEMLQGRLPGWSPALIMRVGETLREQTDQLELLTDAGVDATIAEHTVLVEESYRLRDILVAFGALAPDDKTTGPLDLLEILLPPVEP